MSAEPTPVAHVAHAPWGSPRRWGVFLLGASLLGCGVAASVQASVGVGSWQVFETGLVDTTGWSFTAVIVIESLVALALAWVWLRQPPGPATVVIAFGLGPIVDWMIRTLPEQTSAVAGGAQFTLGTLLIGVGVGLYVAADLGPSAQDALFVGLYRHYPIRPAVARLVLDGALLVGGFALGGQLGLGTAIVTLVLPVVVERSLAAGRRLAGTEDLSEG